MDGRARFQIINIAPCDQTECSDLIAIVDRLIGKRGFQFFFSA